jgi:P27 family predicted phage terminase small subunit
LFATFEMGKRGPKPTPTPTLRLRGSWRENLRTGEPVTTPELPACPSWASSKARTYWAEIGDLLTGLGIMSRPHTVGLTLLVDALADWIRFTKEAENAPSLVEGSTGNQVANPIFALKRHAWEQVLKGVREFGMTPSAISGVKSTKPDEKPAGLAGFKLGA